MSETSSPAAPHADLILRGGPIWTGRKEGVVAALAIGGARVLAAGDEAQAMALRGPRTRIIELRGRLATPGLNDSHMHLINYGQVMGWVDARPAAAPTLDALLAALGERARRLAPGQWVLARGYDQTKLDVGRAPHRDELDRIAPDNPVMLTRACGHVSIFNSRALVAGGLDEASPTPQGGFIEKADGRLSGLVAENARDPVVAAIPAMSEEEIVEAIERGGRALLAMGITSCMDAAVGMTAGYAEIDAYRRAYREGRLPLRVWLTLLGDPGRSVVPRAFAEGLVTGAGDDMLRIGGVKLFLDGSAGGRTAWMKRPYRDADTVGTHLFTDAELRAQVMDLHAKGYRMVCHAIGDAAIAQLVSAYEAALDAEPDPDRRHRIEHCGYVDADINARMVKAGVLPCPQQVFIHDFGDAYIAVLGEERALSSYPIKTWMRLGLRPATGSDAPVCDPNPFPNFHAMLTRETFRGTLMDATERLGIEEALEAYTENGAWSQKLEASKGALRPGMLADVAVFSRDLLTASPRAILEDTRCDVTILGGRVVHERDA